MFLHQKGRIKRPTMARDAFERLSPGKKMSFIRDGGMLKAAGVSDFMAREIVGHESAAVSRQYTHLTTDDKRAAMRRLPDVTND